MKSTYKIAQLLAVFVAALWLSSCQGGGADADPVDYDAKVMVTSTEVSSEKGSMFIKVIVLPTSKWSLELSGGSDWAHLNQTTGTGEKSVILTYDANTEETSRSVTVTMTTPFKSSVTIIQLGHNKANEEGSGDVNGFVASSAKQKWLELPATSASDQNDLLVHTYKSGDKKLRDWSCYWDYDDLVSLWVAYPLNKSLIGSGGRSDEWGLDPLLSSSKQPVLGGAYRNGNNGHYDRGHQLPSADRLNRAQNVTTFYGTNMTPQDNTFNAGIWATLESKVRGWGTSSDTLYVVTGCVLDGAKYYCYDNVSKKVTVPTAYYKAVVRYSANSTLGYSGKNGGKYLGCAVYMEHDPKLSGSIKNFAMSISELEAKIGVDLFVNLPEYVGEENAKKIEEEDPTKISWWW